ncbi:MAG: TetR/AcrR family transcriptional regulator [Actinomycetota bacterium]|nr:TetR/AcrR family transcriptional regulator [Actinomycetota bacterium]
MSVRRRRLPRDQRRQAILGAARQLLLERGYGELTMERVARAAGVSKALVYDHFGHRREVYLAILADERVRMVQRLAPALAGGDRAARVRSSVRAFLELVAEYGDGYAELFRNPVAHDPELAVELARVREGVADLVASVIAGDLEVPVEQVKLPAYAVVGAMEAAADRLTRVPVSQRPPIDATTDVLSRLIWKGLSSLQDLAPTATADPVIPLRRPLR